MSTAFRIKLPNYMHQTFHPYNADRVSKCLKKEKWLLDKCAYVVLRSDDTQEHCNIRVDKKEGEPIDLAIFSHIQNIRDMPPRKNRLGLCVRIWPPKGMCFRNMAFPSLFPFPNKLNEAEKNLEIRPTLSLGNKQV